MDRTIFNAQCDEIYRIFSELTTQGTTVTDGVIDSEKYFNAKPRIMWVLKEADSEDSWSYIDNFKKIDWLNKCNGLSSIRRVIYTSYGILKADNQAWSDFPWSNDIECQSALEEIAFVNIKKTPGGSTSDSNEISAAYQKNRELLKLQIEAYNPEVVIFGNTMNLVDISDFEGLDAAEKEMSKHNNHYYSIGDKLYIHAYHPSYLKFSDKDYVMDIVEIYRKWKNSK